MHIDMATARKDQATIKKVLRRESRVERQANADQVIRSLPAKTQRCAQAAQEKGVSSWLSAVPVRISGLHFTKELSETRSPSGTAGSSTWHHHVVAMVMHSTSTMSCHAAKVAFTPFATMRHVIY